LGVVERFEHQGVEGLRTGRFNLGINTTCILYRIGSTIVDTGPPNQWSTVRRFLDERRVDRVLITHHHEDHSGNGARIGSELGRPVMAPASGVDFLADGFKLRMYQRIIWGSPDRFRPLTVPDEIALGDGLRLRAVHTPGHSPDMTCYLEPERGWLFTGDLYIAGRVRFKRADEQIDPEIASLRLVSKLDFQTLFCAHRGPVADGPAVMRRKFEFLEEFRGNVRRLHGEGRSVAEISKLLLGGETFISWFTGLHFSKRNLIRACLSPSTGDS